eukprot:147641_1
MTNKMKEQEQTIDDQDNQLSELKQALEDERRAKEAALATGQLNEQDSADAMSALTQEKKELKAMVDDLKGKMSDRDEQTIDDQDNQLSELKQALEDERRAKEAALATGNLNEQESADALSALTQEKAQLKKMCDDLKGKMNDRDDEIARLKDEIARLKKALADAKKALDDLVNRARDDKQTQTDLSGKWIDNARMQLANLDNVFRENDELRQLATKNDERLLELADENKVLLDEIDQLLKQQAQFRPDTSNHRGEVLAMCASPINYYAATSATDKSVRLWAIDPTAEKSREQVKPVYRAQMEGVALSLAYTRDGTYLVAGCAYKNGPEGLLIIWNMNKGDGEVEFLFRSRPSVRFGRAHCVRWSDDSRYIFSGDTTGSVWIWDAPNQILLAEVRAHKDVVHDIGVARSAMFSCGLDQTIAVFDMDRLTKKKKKRVKKDKIHVHKPTVFKAKQVNKNDKYPYWVVQPTEDASVLIAGARKMWSFKFTGFKDSDDAKKKDVSDADLDKGPRITDTDLEHVQSIQVRRGQVVISRRELTKVKIFSTSNGSETAKAKFKAPVKRVQFTFDNQNCVVCTQKQDGKKAKPPGMHLWNYKK